VANATPDYYFNVDVSFKWERIMSIAAELVAQSGTPATPPLIADSKDAEQHMFHFTEIFGERHPRRVRGGFRYDLATRKDHVVERSVSRLNPEFAIGVELHEELCWMVFSNDWLSLEPEPYRTYGEAKGRRCLTQIAFWKTLDFLALVECGRYILPPPRSASSSGNYADFDPMPWATDCSLRVGRTSGNYYTLECDVLKMSVEIEPHLDEPPTPESDLNPIWLAQHPQGK
jgi:hypothetical protein